MKEKLLYLCHRIPFPPNKGDKIPAYNILKFLNQHYEIYLGCFIDDPHDNQYQDDVRAMCHTATFIQLNPNMAKLKGISALFSGEPITVPHYRSKQLQQWVDKTLSDKQISKSFIFSGCMAQYLLKNNSDNHHVVMDFVDIDSDKWKQYSDKTNGLMRWVYKREHRTLEAYEKYLTSQFAVSCFVTNTETYMYQAMVDQQYRDRIKTLSNGIDVQFFSPLAESKLAESYDLMNQRYIVFTGAMDYWANVDAVIWFAKTVWPKVKDNNPEALFYIVGSSPDKKVLQLQEQNGIVVTGRVEDVRPYLQNAAAAVAPMQIARGIQNKILEAMAMECPVTATTLGIEGIDGYPTEQLFISDQPSEITEWVITKLNTAPVAATESRNWLIENYSWNARLSPLLEYLGSAGD